VIQRCAQFTTAVGALDEPRALMSLRAKSTPTLQSPATTRSILHDSVEAARDDVVAWLVTRYRPAVDQARVDPGV
jgi:hypothetical protein